MQTVAVQQSLQAIPRLQKNCNTTYPDVGEGGLVLDAIRYRQDKLAKMLMRSCIRDETFIASLLAVSLQTLSEQEYLQEYIQGYLGEPVHDIAVYTFAAYLCTGHLRMWAWLLPSYCLSITWHPTFTFPLRGEENI